MKKKHQNKIRR